MMISTKGRYALRFLVDIAEHQAEGYVPLKDVAERQGISEKYLESIVKTLVRADVLPACAAKAAAIACASPRTSTACVKFYPYWKVPWSPWPVSALATRAATA